MPTISCWLFCQSESSPTSNFHDIKLLIKLVKQLPDGPGIPIVRSKMNVIKKERESTYSYYSRSVENTRVCWAYTLAFLSSVNCFWGRNRKLRAVLWFWR